MDAELEQLIEVIEDVARGNYSDKVMQLTKPEHPEPIRRIAEAVGMMMVQVEAREMRLEGLVEELKLLNEKTRENAVQAVGSIAAALEARDRYTRGHAERVSRYASRLALCMGLGPEEVERVRMGGMLHDVGKINFSDQVFQNEDTRPSEEMMEEIRRHPEVGYEIVRRLEFLDGVKDYVRCHHEHMDGRGYPIGLTGDKIPLGAKIISVADVFDAITSTRTYQEKSDQEKALNILGRLAGQSLDPELVETFAADIRENGLEHGFTDILDLGPDRDNYL